MAVKFPTSEIPAEQIFTVSLSLQATPVPFGMKCCEQRPLEFSLVFCRHLQCNSRLRNLNFPLKNTSKCLSQLLKRRQLCLNHPEAFSQQHTTPNIP